MVYAIESRTVARLPPTWALDLDGGDHQLEVLRRHAPDEIVECRLEGHAQLHVAHDALELLADRRPRLSGDELDALEE